MKSSAFVRPSMLLQNKWCLTIVSVSKKGTEQIYALLLLSDLLSDWRVRSSAMLRILRRMIGLYEGILELSLRPGSATIMFKMSEAADRISWFFE